MKKVLFILIAIFAISCQQNDTLSNLDGFYKVKGRCGNSFPSAAAEIHQIDDETFEFHGLYDSVITCRVTSATTFDIPWQSYERGYIEGTGTVISSDTLHIFYEQNNFGMRDTCSAIIIRQ